jgi:hypothetical protein
MNLITAAKNKIYNITLTFNGDFPAEALIYIHSNTPYRKKYRQIKYELLATTLDPLYFAIKGKSTLKEIPESDLPLYTHFQYKSTTFEELLKQIPPSHKEILIYKSNLPIIIQLLEGLTK